MTMSTTTSEHRSGVRVAYLVSHYPALSHAFIEREILALRALGVDVDTFSVRPSPVEAQLSATAREEAENTYSLLGRGVGDYLQAHVGLLRRSPRSWLAGARAALRVGPGGVKPRIWQFFYLAEAVLLRERMRERSTRHVHVHFANNGADVARSVVTMGQAEDGRNSGWAWSFSMHGPTEFDDVTGHDLPAKVESAEWIACISEFCRDQLRRLVDRSHWDKMSIVRMGVDSTRFVPVGRDREEGAPLRILFVGRLVPEKGPDVLVEAVEALHARGVPLELRVAGGGVLADELERTVRASPAADVIDLLGPVGQDDIGACYAWADVFCLPSFAEGVPVVLMEAMSTGLPVVSTPIAGIPELITDGESGILVGPGDVEHLVEALSRLSADPVLREELGAAGRRRVLEEFQPGPNAERLVAAMQTASHLRDENEGIPA